MNGVTTKESVEVPADVASGVQGVRQCTARNRAEPDDIDSSLAQACVEPIDIAARPRDGSLLPRDQADGERQRFVDGGKVRGYHRDRPPRETESNAARSTEN